MTPPPVIGGRYRLGAVLGAGGTATVHLAERIDTGETLAVKVLHPRLAAEPARWAAFFEEVRAAQAIDHHGVISIVDDGVDAGDPPVVWIAMEYVPGCTLREAVARSGPLTPADALTLADALLDVLTAVHRLGLVHRDVTPANVMFDPTAKGGALRASVRLLDFGVADIVGRSMSGTDVLLSAADDGTRGVVVNVPYASPEQLRAEAVTARSDVYQIGATLFFALTGAAPDDPAATAGGALVAERLRARVPGILDALVDWFTVALDPAPARRFADARVMRAALREVDAGAIADPHDIPAAAAWSEDGEAAEVTRVLPTASEDVTRVYRTRPNRAPLSVAPGTAPVGPPGASPYPGASAMPARGRSRGWLGAAMTLTGVAAVLAVAVTTQSLAAPAPLPVATGVAPTASMSATPVTEDVRPALVVVPLLVGRTRDEAEELLRAAGLIVGDVREEDGATATGFVLQTDPSVGAEVYAGTSISLVVASGSNVVPETDGLSIDAATVAVRDAGFDVEVPLTGGSTPTGGAVRVSTLPAAGTRLPLGSRVSLVVPTPSPTPSVSVSPTPMQPGPSPTAATPTPEGLGG